MKKLILIIIFALLATTIVNSQTEPIFSKNSKWSIISSNAPAYIAYEIHDFKLGEDTIIGGQTYSKVFRDNIYYNALRETEDHKIYVYYPPEYDINYEILLYDFKWEANKTLQIQAADPFYPDVYDLITLGNEIDSIQLLDGKYYQYIDCYGGTLIRGIGHTKGFDYLISPQPTCFCPVDLLCFYIDDELVFRSPYYVDCDGTSQKIVSGKVTINGEPLEGVEISYYSEYNVVQGSVFTDEDGYYSIPIHVYLDLTITPNFANFVFDPPKIELLKITKDSANNNFAAISTEPIKYTVSGTIKIDEIIPLEDVTILYTDDYIEDSTFTNQY